MVYAAQTDVSEAVVRKPNFELGDKATVVHEQMKSETTNGIDMIEAELTLTYDHSRYMTTAHLKYVAIVDGQKYGFHGDVIGFTDVLLRSTDRSISELIFIQARKMFDGANKPSQRFTAAVLGMMAIEGERTSFEPYETKFGFTHYK